MLIYRISSYYNSVIILYILLLYILLYKKYISHQTAWFPLSGNVSHHIQFSVCIFFPKLTIVFQESPVPIDSTKQIIPDIFCIIYLIITETAFPPVTTRNNFFTRFIIKLYRPFASRKWYFSRHHFTFPWNCRTQYHIIRPVRSQCFSCFLPHLAPHTIFSTRQIT